MSQHPNTTTNALLIPAQISCYLLNEKVYEDNISSIYKATNNYTQTQCTAIIYSKELSYYSIASIHREIFSLKMLKHKNIISLLEVIESKSHIYLFTEPKTGKELFEHITERKRLSEKEALSIFQQLIEAMKYMHKMTIAHRDIRPENIIITNSNGMIKLINFGSSVIYNKEQLIQDYREANAYSCPEIILEKGYSGVKCDVWSCGVLLYSMVCGFLPFCEEEDEKNKEMIIKGDYLFPEKGLSDQVRDLMKNMLEIDPLKRYDFYQIINHQWFNSNKPTVIDGLNVLEYKYPIDKRILALCSKYGFDQDKITQELMNNNMTHGTAVYMLCVKMVLENKKMSCSDLCSREFVKYLEVQKNQYTVSTTQKRREEMIESEKKIIEMIQKEEEELMKKEEENLIEIDNLMKKNYKLKELNEDDPDAIFSISTKNRRSQTVSYKYKPTLANILKEKELKLKKNNFLRRNARIYTESMKQAMQFFEEFKNESPSVNSDNSDSQSQSSSPSESHSDNEENEVKKESDSIKINNDQIENPNKSERNGDIDEEVEVISNDSYNNKNDCNRNKRSSLLKMISESDLDSKSSDSRIQCQSEARAKKVADIGKQSESDVSAQLELYENRIVYKDIEDTATITNEEAMIKKKQENRIDYTGTREQTISPEVNPASALVLLVNAIAVKTESKAEQMSDNEMRIEDKSLGDDKVEDNKQEKEEQSLAAVLIDDEDSDIKKEQGKVVDSIKQQQNRHNEIAEDKDHDPQLSKKENRNNEQKIRSNEIPINQPLLELVNSTIINHEAIEQELNLRNGNEVHNAEEKVDDELHKHKTNNTIPKEIVDPAGEILYKTEDKNRNNKNQSSNLIKTTISKNDISPILAPKGKEQTPIKSNQINEEKFNTLSQLCSPSPSPSPSSNENENEDYFKTEINQDCYLTNRLRNENKFETKPPYKNQITPKHTPTMKTNAQKTKIEFNNEEFSSKFLNQLNKTAKPSRANSKIKKKGIPKPFMTRMTSKEKNNKIDLIKSSGLDNFNPSTSYAKISQLNQPNEKKKSNLKKSSAANNNKPLGSKNKVNNNDKPKHKEKNIENEKVTKKSALKNGMSPYEAVAMNTRTQQTTPTKSKVKGKKNQEPQKKNSIKANNSTETLINNDDHDCNKQEYKDKTITPHKSILSTQKKASSITTTNQTNINNANTAESQLKDILLMRINEQKDQNVQLKPIKEKKAVIKPLMMLNSKTLFVSSAHKPKQSGTGVKKLKLLEKGTPLKKNLRIGTRLKHKNNSQEICRYISTESANGKMVYEDTIESTRRTLNHNNLNLINYFTARSNNNNNANDDCGYRKSSRIPNSSQDSNKHTDLYQHHNAIAIVNTTSLTIAGNGSCKENRIEISQIKSYSGPIDIVCIASSSLNGTINNLLLKLKDKSIIYNQNTKLNYSCWKADLSFDVEIVELDNSDSLAKKLYYYLVKIEDGAGADHGWCHII